MFSFIENKKQYNQLQFRIKHIDLSIVNSLRRTGVTSIPNVAFDFDMEHPDYETNDTLKVLKNTSPLHNEFLLHRISLVPFCFSAEEIDSFDSSEYLFKLNIKGAKNAITPVTTGDIEIFDSQGKKYPEEFHKRIFPRNKITQEHLLIVKLKEDQEIDLEFRLTKDCAERHSRWCPVSQFTYSYVFDDSRPDSKATILEMQRTFVKDKHGDPALFDFKIQSECALSPAYIFGKSIDILKEKIAAIPDQMKTELQKDTGMYIISIDGDMTVANVLQSLVYNRCIRDASSKELDFIGYYQPHPLVKTTLLKLKPLSSRSTTFDVNQFMKDQCSSIIAELKSIKAEWEKFSENKL